jgi:hypothetical protein
MGGVALDKIVCSDLHLLIQRLIFQQRSERETDSTSPSNEFPHRSRLNEISQALESDWAEVCRRTRYSTNLLLLPSTYALDTRGTHISMEYPISYH